MPSVHAHNFDTPGYKGVSEIPLGLYINGQFVDGKSGKTHSVVNPSTGKEITKISLADLSDVDVAVASARKAFNTTWGLHAPGHKRAKLLAKLADIMEEHADEMAAVEALDNGKTFFWAKNADITASIECIRYYSGWADKIQGKTIETTDAKFCYTRHEPIGVCGQIIPWNFPLLMLAWKVGPALATGNTIVLKPSEITPLSAQLFAKYTHEAGFPPGVVNIINGFGYDIGAAIAEHMDIDKVAFTGSTLVGRKIMEAAAKTNLKKVTLELGGKSPNIIFDDCDLEAAVEWAAFGIFWNHGQTCCAGSRIFVHAKIYDQFMEKFVAKAKQIKLGDPFHPETKQGPQVSEAQFDRIMGYIESGKADGATVHHGGERFGDEGYFISPTIFGNVRPDMKIVKEEIFGPVGVVIKFEDDEDVLRQANDTVYGLAAAVFSKNINRAIETAHKLQAGTVWINSTNMLHHAVPFGGFKSSGIGRELGEYALSNYTEVKAVHIHLGPTSSVA